MKTGPFKVAGLFGGGKGNGSTLNMDTHDGRTLSMVLEEGENPAPLRPIPTIAEPASDLHPEILAAARREQALWLVQCKSAETVPQGEDDSDHDATDDGASQAAVSDAEAEGAPSVRVIGKDGKTKRRKSSLSDTLKRLMSRRSLGKGRACTCFGQTLSSHLRDTRSTVPPLVIMCCQEVEKRGLDVEGIYRLSGKQTSIKEMHDKVVAMYLGFFNESGMSPQAPRRALSFPRRTSKSLEEMRATIKRSHSHVRDRMYNLQLASFLTGHKDLQPTTSNHDEVPDNDHDHKSLAESHEHHELPGPRYPQGVPWDADTSIIAIAALLKLYFHELPECVVTAHLYPLFVQAGRNGAPVDTVKDLVGKLPYLNYTTLDYVIRHLTVVASNSPKNCMTAENLGVCFGPTLIFVHGKGGTVIDPMKMAEDSKAVGVLVASLIKNYNEVFLGPPHTTGDAHEDSD